MMSRIRTVKPELFRHPALFEAEEKYQLPLRIAFIGLFTCCDRQGRFLWQPRRLKVDILPYDNADISEVLKVLLENGFIKAYEVRGIVYGCIPTWQKHQYFNNKEPESKLPGIHEGRILVPPIQQTALDIHAQFAEEAFARTMPELNQSVPNIHELHGSDSSELSEDLALAEPVLTPDLSSVGGEQDCSGTGSAPVSKRVFDAWVTGGSLNGKERKGKEKEKNIKTTGKNSKQDQSPSAAMLSIFGHWQKVMEHPQARLDGSRQKSIREALAMGYSVAELCQAIDGCRLTPYNMGLNDRGQRYDGFHIVFKSADQIDRFIGNAVCPPQPPNKADHRLQGNASAAQAWLSKQQQTAGESMGEQL